jgi:hypothetical protein
MSRTTILSEVIQNAMVEAIREGNYASTASEAVGIGESTHYRWMKQGEEGIEPYRGYWEAIKKAEAQAEMSAVKKIRDEGDKNWTANAWYLERKFPERWGRKDKLTQEISGKDGKPIEIDSKSLVLAMLGHAPAQIEDAEIVDEGSDGTKSI